MLLAIVLFCVGDIAIVAVIVFFYRKLVMRIDKLENTGLELSSYGQALGGRVDSHAVQIAELKDQIAEMAFREETLSAKLGEHLMQVNDLQHQFVELNSRAKGLSGRLDDADRFIKLIDVLRDDE
jgi:chromosome segregation ATPase